MRRLLWRLVWRGIERVVEDPTTRLLTFFKWAEARYGEGRYISQQAHSWARRTAN